MRIFEDYVTGEGVTLLGGIIIEIQGEMAVAHHGGYRGPDGHWTMEPIVISWRTEGQDRIFQLPGWSCRVLAAIEGDRWISMIDAPICVRDGMFTVVWSHPEEAKSRQVKVYDVS